MIACARAGEDVVTRDSRKRIPIVEQRFEVRVALKIRIEDVQGQVMPSWPWNCGVVSHQVEGHTARCGAGVDESVAHASAQVGKRPATSSVRFHGWPTIHQTLHDNRFCHRTLSGFVVSSYTHLDIRTVLQPLQPSRTLAYNIFVYCVERARCGRGSCCGGRGSGACVHCFLPSACHTQGVSDKG